jgi:hypothetical protein
MRPTLWVVVATLLLSMGCSSREQLGDQSDAGVDRGVAEAGADGRTDGGTGPDGSPWLDDGVIVFSHGSRIRIMQADGSGQRALTSGVGVDRDPHLAPDGERVFFSSDRDDPSISELYVVDLYGQSTYRLMLDLSQNDTPAVSPDGALVAFGSTRDGDYQLYLAEFDGSAAYALRRILDDPDPGRRWPSFSPDGTRIVYVCGGEVCAVGWDGTARAQLTRLGQAASSPRYSPDGTRIVFALESSAGTAIWVVNADGGAPHELVASDGDRLGGPCFSPDGTRIAYARHPSIWVMDLDGANARDLSRNADAGNPDQSPHWGLAGRPEPAPGTSCEVIASGDIGPRDVVVDDAFVYWVTSDDQSARVRRAPKAGGPAVSLAEGQAWPAALVLHGEHAYWVNPEAGILKRVAKDGGAAPSLLAVDLVGVYRLAVDDAHVYAARGSSLGLEAALLRVPVDGGSAEVLVGGVEPQGLAVTATDIFYFYWSADYSDQLLVRRSKATGEETVLGLAEESVTGALGVDAEYLYYVHETQPAPISGAGTVRRTPISGGTDGARSFGIERLDLVGPLVDDAGIYWRSHHPLGGGAIKRMSKAGGPVRVLVVSEAPQWGLAVDATHVYWTEFMMQGSPAGGVVCRAPKG